MKEYVQSMTILLLLMIASSVTLFWLTRRILRPRPEKPSPKKIMDQRIKMVTSFLEQSPPRRNVPKHVFYANRHRTSDLIGMFVGVICLVGLPLGTAIYTADWLYTLTLGPLLPLVAGIIWASKNKRKRLLTLGLVVNGKMGRIKPRGIAQQDWCGAYSVTFTFEWQGHPRKATQMIYDAHATGFFDSSPGNIPVRLLVDPRNPRKVLWTETLLSNPLPSASD